MAKRYWDRSRFFRVSILQFRSVTTFFLPIISRLISYPDLPRSLFSVKQSEIWIRDYISSSLNITCFRTILGGCYMGVPNSQLTTIFSANISLPLFFWPIPS